jgi:hypothetical protein
MAQHNQLRVKSGLDVYSAIRAARGSEEPTRTPTVCYGNISLGAPTSRGTRAVISTLSLLPLTPDPGRPWVGKLPPRLSLSSYHRTRPAVLQRLLEPNQFRSGKFLRALRSAA